MVRQKPSHSQTARASRAPRTASTAGARTRRGADTHTSSQRKRGPVNAAANHRGDPRSGARGLSPAEPEPLSDRARQHLGPQSQSLFRSYGSNLPTSLTYVVPMARGFQPWRPDAVVGTTWTGTARRAPRFSWDGRGSPDTPGDRGALPRLRPPPRSTRFRGTTSGGGEKRTLPGAAAAVSGVGGVAAHGPVPGSGRRSPIPFRHPVGEPGLAPDRPFRGCSRWLRID